MAFTATELEILRRKQQAQKFFLAVENPTTVWTARVSGSPNTGAISINYTSEVVTATPISGYTLLVGTTAGAYDKGIVRFRSKSGGVMSVGYNHIEWSNGLYLTVIKQMRPWALFPSVDGAKEDQDVVYSTQNTQVDPIARIGSSAVCAFRDLDGYARVKFYSSSSAVTGSLSSHAWTFSGGLPASSSSAGSSGSPIEVLFGATGQYWVTYTVTDTNGKSSTRYCIVYVFDREGPSSPLTAEGVDTITGVSSASIQVDNLGCTYEDGGWNLDFTSYGVSNWLEGSQVVLFCEQYWSGQAVNIGVNWTYRENILFFGWIRGSRTSKSADKSVVKVSCYGPIGWLKEAEAWPANLSNGTSGWHGLGSSITPDRAALHLIREHSTLGELCDINLTGDTNSLLYVDCAEDRLYNQINTQIYDSIKAHLMGDHLGRIGAERNQQLIPVASRTAGAQIDITSEDWRDELDLGEETDFYRVSQIDFAGFYYSGADPKKWYSLAPGRELPTGAIEQVTGVRADTQSETNILAGLYLAWRNNEYNDVTMPMAGFFPADIYPQTRITLTLAATENKRGLSWSSKAFWIRGVTYNLSNGAILTEWKLEAESDGPPGVTNLIPEDTPPAYPDYAGAYDIPEITPTDVPDATDTAGDGSLTYVVTTTKVTRTRNFLDASPNYTNVTGAITGSITDFILDPFDPKNKAWTFANSGVWKTTDLDSTAPTWTNILTAAQINTLCGTTQVIWSSIKANITASGYILIYTQDNAGGFDNGFVLRTTDDGVTWAAVNATGNNVGNNGIGGFEWGQHDTNTVLAGYSNGRSTNRAEVIKSTDKGASFSNLSGEERNNNSVCDIHMPYENNATHQIFYVVYRDAVYRTINGGSSWTDITPASFGSLSKPRYMIHSYTANRLIMMLTNQTTLWYSSDGGDNWIVQSTFSSSRALGGFPYDGGKTFRLRDASIAPGSMAADPPILASSDNGATWTNKTGDYGTAIGTFATGIMIVPVWVS